MMAWQAMASKKAQRAYDIFGRAIQLPPAERAALLNEACGGDEELCAEILSLLQHDSRVEDGFLKSPVAGRAAAGETAAHTPARIDEVGDGSGVAQAADPNDDAPAATDRPARAAGSLPQFPGYRTIRKLDHGGQGVVYQALQQSTKRKVAIKILLDGPHASMAAERRFEREIELVGQLRHPNIIGIFHSGTTPDGRRFYVMDYVRGTPLHQYVRDEKLPLEKTLSLFSSVCDAVQYAHHKGVIHRDLKPGNILVDSDGVPKILDFGLAKWAAGPIDTVVSLSEQVIGTLPYMSPEQARGNPDEIDTRTDIYALGVILYELLTGHYPYPVVGNVIEVLKHITDTPPTPPSRSWKPSSGITQRTSKRLRAGQCPIDDEVQTLILKALSKERERRYQSAGEMALDVGRYLAGQPIEAKRDSAFYVLSKTLRRYRTPIAVGAALTLVILTAFIYSAASWRHMAKQQQRIEELERAINASSLAVREKLPRGPGAPILAELESDEAADGSPSSADRVHRLLDRERALERRKGQATTLDAYTANGDYEGAGAYITEQLGGTPDDAFLTAYRGYLRVKRYSQILSSSGIHEFALLESARQDFQRSIVLDSGQAAIAHEGIGNTCYLKARSTHAAADFQAAIDAYSKAIHIKPDFIRAHSNRGHAYFDAGRYFLALNDYAVAISAGPERLSESVPDAWRTYFNYGVTLRLLGASEEAIGRFREAVTEAPDNLYCDLALALAYLDIGEDDNAEECLELGKQKAAPDTWEGKLVRCLLLELPPEQLITAAGEPGGDLCEAHYFAGEAFLRRGEQESAQREFQKCIAECESADCIYYNEYLWAKWRSE